MAARLYKMRVEQLRGQLFAFCLREIMDNDISRRKEGQNYQLTYIMNRRKMDKEHLF